METSFIEVRSLARTYKGGVRALRSVDLDIPRGGCFALLGPNGAGKSTLVRILCTLSRPDSGSARINGMPLTCNMERIRSVIGVALQEVGLDPDASVEEHLIFQGRLFGMEKTESRRRAKELLERFGLTFSAERRAGELSGGNRRRLHTALALVHRPKILFLDEPTVGMDPEIRSEFWTEIRRLNREENVTIFFTTQYLEEAQRHAKGLGVIESGRLVYRGTVEEFIRERSGGETESLEDGYLRFLEELREKEVVHA